MMKALVLLIAFLYSNLTVVYSNSDSSDIEKADLSEKPDNYLGVSASLFSSLGLSYHHLFGIDQSFGLKFTFFLYPDRYTDDKTWTFMGAELQFTLKSSEQARTYILFGLGTVIPNNDNESLVFFGPGFGIEFIEFGSVAFNFDIGASIWARKIHDYPLRDEKIDFNINLGLGLVLSYAF